MASVSDPEKNVPKEENVKIFTSPHHYNSFLKKI